MTELILVADDDPFDLKLLSEVCENAGYAVAAAADGPAVLESVARTRPSLILLDVSITRMNGLEVCRILKSDPSLRDIPIIIVTPADDGEGRARGMEAGADDWVTKPFRLLEIQQRLRAALRLHEARGRLVEAHGKLRELEPHDRVTGAGTPHQLRLSLDYEFMRAARYGHPLCLVAMGIDRLGELRRTDGIEAADRTLAELVEQIRGALRATDLLFRLELDVFVVLLPETAAPGAETVAARIRRSFDESGPQPRLGIVLGAALYPSRGIATNEALLRSAIDHLARARQAGAPLSASWNR